jgi:Homeodomain-like domain
MPSRFGSVTSPRFERRLPVGRHDLVFRVAFGSDAAAARALGVSRMTVWRWRHDRGPLPEFLLNILPDSLQSKVAEAHEAQQEFRAFLAEGPSGQSIHPLQLNNGTIVFVKRRRAPVRHRA